MRLIKIASNALALLVLFAGAAQAGAQNGFGLNGGIASHTRDCGGCSGSTTSGLSIGIDYQFALSERFSISPFLMSSGESTSVSGVSAGHGILGAQFRFWADDVFFGGHIGSYTEVFSDGAVSISGSGPGAGLVVGWEKNDGGFYMMGQLDSATVKYSNLPDIKFTGFRLSAGYRWK